MRKIKRILILAIVTIIGVASFGCKPSNESAYPVYGDFVCNIVTKRDGNKFISIRELSDAGKNKNSIIVPNKIDGYEVRIGRTGIWSYGGYWESDKLKNVYVCKSSSLYNIYFIISSPFAFSVDISFSRDPISKTCKAEVYFKNS